MEHIWNTYEDMNEIIYVADMDTYELVYLNRRARELYGITSTEQVKGKKCYEFLQNNSQPCAMCTNYKLGDGHICEWEYYNSYIGKLFQLRDQMIVDQQRRLRIEVAMEHTDGTLIQTGQGQESNNMTLLINECMRMALQESDPIRGICQLLEYLGKALHGERVYIFELSEQNEWNNTYEWCAYNVTAEIDFLQHIPYNTIDVWLRAFNQKRFVIIRNIDQMKESDPDVYEYLQPQNIQSIIVGPLYKDGVLTGFYGIDNPPVDKIDEAAAMIKTISHVIETMISKRDLMNRLEDLSYHDQMLQLGNRHALQRYLKEIDPQTSIGIVYCDVCGLKRVNDTMGHAAGDELLLHACACLQKAFPGYGLYRIGGDEMLAVATGIDEQTFATHCKNLRVLMLEKDVPLAIGTVWSPKIQEETESMIAEADARMYQDKVQFYKKAGLSRWRSSEAWFGTMTRYEDIVECVNSGLEKALEEGQFVVYYQPQYNQRDHSLYGAEALVRWQHPQKGLISPDSFIPYLEQNGMISKLDEYVLRETCRCQRQWLDNGMKAVPISVNLSRVDLQSEEICYRVRDTLAQFALPVEYINLEVTESAYMENPESVIEVVRKFQELGFKVEMDDFGSGYSSLNSLKDIPVDILKLDMKFVEGDSISARSGTILSSITRMAHGMSMPVIAEGVETKEQATFLTEIGCFYVQGYYFDRPLPLAEFEQRLLRAKPDLERDGRFTRKNEKNTNYFATDGAIALLLDNTIGAAGIIEYNGSNIELVRSNEAMYEMFGIHIDDGRMHPYAEVFYQGKIETYRNALNKAVESMDVSECVTQNVQMGSPDKPFWTRTRFKYLHSYDGEHTVYITVENVDESWKMKQTNTMLFRIMEELEKGGAFGAIMLQLGEKDQIPYFNSVAAVILGYTAEECRELFDRDPYGAVLPEDRELLQTAIDNALAQQSGMMTCTIRHICKNGRIKSIPIVGVVGMNATGAKYIRLMLLDKPDTEMLAAQMQAESLREQEAMLQDMQAVTEAIGGAYLCGSMKEKMILEVSRPLLTILGYPVDNTSLRYSALESIVWPGDWSIVQRKMHEAEVGHRMNMELEFRIQTKQGKQKWVHVDYHVVRKANHREDFYMSFTEVDDIQRLKWQIRKQQHLQHLLDNNPMVGVVYYHIIGKRWKIDYISEGNLQLFGYTDERLRGLIANDLLALVHPDDRELLRALAFKQVKEKRSYQVSYRMLNAVGEYVVVLTYAIFFAQNDELFLCQTNLLMSQVETEQEAGFCIYAE